MPFYGQFLPFFFDYLIKNLVLIAMDNKIIFRNEADDQKMYIDRDRQIVDKFVFSRYGRICKRFALKMSETCNTTQYNHFR